MYKSDIESLLHDSRSSHQAKALLPVNLLPAFLCTECMHKIFDRQGEVHSWLIKQNHLIKMFVACNRNIYSKASI